MIAIGLGCIIFLSMFCSAQFLLFLSAVVLIGLGVSMLFFSSKEPLRGKEECYESCRF